MQTNQKGHAAEDAIHAPPTLGYLTCQRPVAACSRRELLAKASYPRQPAQGTPLHKRAIAPLVRWALQARIKRLQAKQHQLARTLSRDFLALQAHGLKLETSGLAFMQRRIRLQKTLADVNTKLMNSLAALNEVQS